MFKSISYFRVLGNKGHAVYEAKAFEKHFNMYKVLHFMVCMSFLMKSKGFLSLKFLLCFPIFTQLLYLSVCSAEVSHAHKTGLFFIPVST